MKRGEIEKLIFPFNTAGALEVYMPELGNWYRVTAKDFRSFDGKRRITAPSTTTLGNTDIPTVTEEYNGPVYLWGTNTEVLDTTGEGQLITSAYWEKANKISGSRG